MRRKIEISMQIVLLICVMGAVKWCFDEWVKLEAKSAQMTFWDPRWRELSGQALRRLRETAEPGSAGKDGFCAWTAEQGPSKEEWERGFSEREWTLDVTQCSPTSYQRCFSVERDGRQAWLQASIRPAVLEQSYELVASVWAVAADGSRQLAYERASAFWKGEALCGGVP